MAKLDVRASVSGCMLIAAEFALGLTLLAACTPGETPVLDPPQGASSIVADRTVGPTEALSTRSFQMALWHNPPAINADLAFFSELDPQPPGESVLWVESWWNPAFDTHLGLAELLVNRNYDWSRIVATVIDEPYWYMTGGVDASNPCRRPEDPRNAVIARIEKQLAHAAVIIGNLSASTRIWINFSVPEIEWARDPSCPVRINQPYIDVISIDSYWGAFDEVVLPYYAWLFDNRATPYQQFALVPGTFFREHEDSQAVRASYLQGYFDYANAMNQRCDLPMGRVGITGNWDGCLVWLIAGYTAHTQEANGYVWRGLLDPSSTLIAAAWTRELAKAAVYPNLSE